MASKTPKPTWHPRIKEDVQVSGSVLSGPTDADGCHHCNVHVVLSNNAVCRRSDGHGYNVVRGVSYTACPGGLTVLGGEDRNVGALAVRRIGA